MVVAGTPLLALYECFCADTGAESPQGVPMTPEMVQAELEAARARGEEV